MKKIIFLLTLISFITLPVYAKGRGDSSESTRQERKFIMSGNKLYGKNKYSEALKQYELALHENPRSAVAAYNAGLSRLRLAALPGIKEEDRKKYEEAGKQSMQSVSRLGEANPQLASKASYNLGNMAFNSQDYQSALGYYKQALRLNPDDNDARRNLRITQKKLQNQNQDKNKQNQNQDKKKDDKQQQDKQQNKKDQQEKKDDRKQQPQTPDNRISEQTADQILKAMENKEAQTRAKVMNPQKQNSRQRQSRRPW